MEQMILWESVLSEAEAGDRGRLRTGGELGGVAEQGWPWRLRGFCLFLWTCLCGQWNASRVLSRGNIIRAVKKENRA